MSVARSPRPRSRPRRPSLLNRLAGSLVIGIGIASGLVGAALVLRGGPGTDGRPPVPTNSLAALVPDAGQRAAVSQFYRDMSICVGLEDGIQTAEQFRTAQSIGAKVLQQAGAMQLPAGLNDPISKRIEAAIGLDPGPLDVKRRAALADALFKISEELQ